MGDPRVKATELYRLAARIHAEARYGEGFEGYRDEMAFRHAMQSAWAEVEKARLVRRVPQREALESYRRGGLPGTEGFAAAAQAAEEVATWLEEAKDA